MSSLYFSEKFSEKFSESPLPSEAYVIRKWSRVQMLLEFCLIFFPSTDASIKSTSENNFFSLQDETVSDTLLDKFNDITANNSIGDRVITKIKIQKDCLTKDRSIMEQPLELTRHPEIKYATLNSRRIANREMHSMFKSEESIFGPNPPKLRVKRLSAKNDGGIPKTGLTLGISIVQGLDNMVYVKDLVPNGPGARSGVKIGDQVSYDHPLGRETVAR